MKKIVRSNLFLIMVLVVILSGGAIVLFSNNNYYREERVAPDEDSNYDKMQISYVTIKERKTGLPNFDNVSDMDGHDASEDDNYIRTYDQITYVLEVGIERNESTTTQNDVLRGGKIKVKAKIPSSDILYMNVVKDTWMQNVTVNDNYTELTATYVIPSEKMAVGGTQQLSFTFGTMGKELELSPNQLPIFEVWMDGNKPDNSNSSADSVSKQDNKPLTITGRIDPRLAFYTNSSSNKINNPGEINGVKGQFINFFSRIYSDTGRGTEDPVNKLSSTFKIEYRYKNIDQDTDWINLDTIDGVNPINNTILYSWGRPCEETPGFWPTSNSNTSNDTDYCAYKKGTKSVDNKTFWYELDSGVMNATQNGVNVDFSNQNFYCNSSVNSYWQKKYASQGFELFVPWYEPTPGRYQYEIKIIDNSLTVEDHNGQEYTVNPNQVLTFTFKNTVDGNFSYSFSGSGNDIFTDVTEIPFGTSKYFYNDLNASDGPYEGGMDRLIVWNSKYIDVDTTKTSYPSVSYSNYGITTTPSTSDVVFKYGVYKTNPNEGVTSDDLVNAATFDSFDWYDTRDEALSHGVITAVRANEPKWQGNNVSSRFYSPYLIPKSDVSNFGKTGSVRFWAYVYRDEARTQQPFVIGDESSYIGAVIKDDYSGVLSNATPIGLGQTYMITGITLSLSANNTDYIGNTRKTNYSVEDEVINMQISPSFSAGTGMTGTANFKIEAAIPKDLSYIANSCEYEPTSVTTNNSGVTTVIWNFNDWDLTNPLPKLNYKLEISSTVQNNVSKTVTSYVSSPSVFGSRKIVSTSFTISNLAGSSIRKALSKDLVERDESITINDYIYNIAQSNLINFKTIEILPKNNDSNGSHFSGSYTMKVLSLANTQRMFYTTNAIDNIGLVTDSIGRMHIQNVDLVNDNRWQELHVGDTIPFNATAIASYVPEIAGLNDVNYKLQFIPSGNVLDDVYYFQLNGSSDNLDNSITSGKKQVKVIDRQISGLVFVDVNHNGIYDNGIDRTLENAIVKLYDSNDTLIKEMKTNSNGYYEAVNFEKGSYYITYTLETGMDFVEKNAGAANVSSVINKSTGKSDLINIFNQDLTTTSIMMQNQNVGIEYKGATVTVHHFAEGTTNKLCDDVIYNLRYNDIFTVDSCATLTDPNYTFKNVVNNSSIPQQGTKVSGTIQNDNIEIIYYYKLKPGQIVVHYLETGTNNRLADDIIGEGVVNQEFVIEAKEFEGYKLVRAPESNRIIFKENTQDVVYEYEKIKYSIDVEVGGGVGTITGAEEVDYGGDSTKDYIVITPGEGYEIDTLIVDGKEVALDNRDAQILENFKNVKNDIDVKVSFREKVMPMPRTSKSSQMVIIALITLSIAGVGFVYYKTKNS